MPVRLSLTFVILLMLAFAMSSTLANPSTPLDPNPDKLPALLKDLDRDLPHYIPLPGVVKGTIRIAGSETMERLLRRWGADFTAIYPNVTVEITTSDSAGAMLALTQGKADFGAMIRQPTQAEQEFLSTVAHIQPTQIIVGGDMLAVIVNHRNPIAGLQMEQLTAIYGRPSSEHPDHDLTHWTQLGVQKEASKSSPIHLYGRPISSVDHYHFQARVLSGRPFKENVAKGQESADLIRTIAADPLGIGYVSSSRSMAGVRIVPLAKEEEFFAPTIANFGRYPLSRDLYLTMNLQPLEKLGPLPAEFIRFVYSQEGQNGLVREGFVPVTARNAEADRDNVCPLP